MSMILWRIFVYEYKFLRVSDFATLNSSSATILLNTWSDIGVIFFIRLCGNTNDDIAVQ